MQNMNDLVLDTKAYRRARLARDKRFDGLFFTAVKTTGIYCRSVCSARPPKECNVEYYPQAYLAQQAGYRPCLRCRPDSAPGSPAWRGVDATVLRAKQLIDDGALEEGNLAQLATRLGVSDRYLRKLFEQQFGIAPKAYALFQQCHFAKQLLHQTNLPITQIALASGFGSVRRFNDCFKQQMAMTPTQVRKSVQESASGITLKIHYRPPYNWAAMQQFLAQRFIPNMEVVGDDYYGRSFAWDDCRGSFIAKHNAEQCRFDVTIDIDTLSQLRSVVNNIRRVLDVNTDMRAIEQLFDAQWQPWRGDYSKGLRLPGIWHVFEAGIRAILGQQVSIVAARKLVMLMIDTLGEEHNGRRYFPTAESIAESSLAFLKMPAKRRQTLKDFSHLFVTTPEFSQPDNWLNVKGIGQWTVDYAKMRGLSDPDIYLGGDLGVQKAMADNNTALDVNAFAPFRSYLTFQLWKQ